MTEQRLKISPPWVTYVHYLEALFDVDPQIAFNIDWEVPSVVLTTNNPDKAAALNWLLPDEKQFGNITLTIGIDCDNISNLAFTTAKELFETAFKNNPVFAYVVVPSTEYWTVPFTYVVFKNHVVQFFNDNLNDPRGLMSTLYQEIASEVFADMNYPLIGGVAYCTDIEEKLAHPLGEWP